LRRTEKLHGILLRFVVGIVTRYAVNRGPWNKTGGVTPWMASTASAGVFQNEESETPPPIIAQLHACHLKLEVLMLPRLDFFVIMGYFLHLHPASKAV